MKLDKIYQSKQNRVFVEYVQQLGQLLNPRKDGRKLLTEGKKIVVTVDLDDEGTTIKKEAKEQFIEQAKNIGQFDNSEWLKQLINGMKQAGVQGVSQISEGDRPVTMNEVRKLISMLVTLISK
jgi:5S rRNA maturation endonuclease (ribonuclease M5)